MPSPYFGRPWPTFTYRGRTYELDHLNEAVIRATDSDEAERTIIVSFGDHCFTRKPEPDDDPALRYPGSSRVPVGHFCPTRYELSLGLPELVRAAASGWAWNLRGEHFALVPTVTAAGVPVLYAVVFSLDRAGKGLPADLHMRVRSAHPRDEWEMDTFGKVKFAHLMALRLQGKQPRQVTERGRQRPRLWP